MTGTAVNILIWIVFGGIAGWVASLVVSGDAAIGIIGNIVLGVLGAFVGGFIADVLGASNSRGAERPSSALSFFWAVVGAVAVLLLINFIF